MSTLDDDVNIDPHASTPSNDSLADLTNDDYPIASSRSSPFRPPPSTDTLLSPLIAEDFSRRLQVRKLQNVTYLSGVSLIVGNQIGAGIFSSPSLVNRNAGSVGMSLIVWIVAGCFAWAGASSYAELGSAIPLNGGARVYLDHTFGPMFGFLFSWTTISAVKPASLGIISIIFAEYVNRILFQSLKPNDTSPVLADKVVALLCVWIIITLQSMGSRWGTVLNNLFTFLKVMILLAIAVIGMVVLASGHGTPNFGGNPFEGSSTDLGNYALALYAGLWAYNGWDNGNYVVAEMENPARNLSRVIHSAAPIVIISYLSANIGFYAVLPMDVVNSSQTIALDFGAVLFGSAGGNFFAICVAASCFGTMNASIFTAARLIHCAGQDNYLPSTFGELHPKRMTPIKALMLHGVLSSFLIIIGDFAWLIMFKGIVEWTWYFVTVLALIVLRVREPTLERPYKVFITTPVLFCCAALFLVSRGVLLGPLQTVLAVVFILVGIPLYYTLVLGWRTIPGLRLIAGLLGVGNYANSMGSQTGYNLAGQEDSEVISGAI